MFRLVNLGTIVNPVYPFYKGRAIDTAPRLVRVTRCDDFQ